jgi:hypothetical protein
VVEEIFGVVKLALVDCNKVPLVAASYQSMVSPAPANADISTVPVEHLVPFVPEGEAGNALTVAVTTVLVAEIQPVVVFLASA